MIWLHLPEGGAIELTTWTVLEPGGDVVSEIDADPDPDPWQFDMFS